MKNYHIQAVNGQECYKEYERYWFNDELSRPLWRHTYKDGNELRALVQHLFEEFNWNKTKKKMAAIRCIILDLFVVNSTTDGMGTITIFTSNGCASDKESRQYEVLKSSGETIRGEISTLKLRGYIDYKPGVKGSGTKIRATTALAALFSAFGISIDKISCRVAHPIRWNEKIEFEGELVKASYKLEGTVADTASKVEILQYARLLRKSRIKIGNIDLLAHEKLIYRIFHDDQATTGGRIYGPLWQRIPRDARSYITINGEPTCEIDICSTHPLIAYAFEDIDLTSSLGKYGKPYELSFMDSSDPAITEICKKALLTIFNSQSQEEARKALWDDIRKREDLKCCYMALKSLGIDAKHIVYGLQLKHQRINDYHFNDAWKNLMYSESEIAMRVVSHFIKSNKVILTVHDSFIVQTRYKEELENVIIHEIQEELDFSFKRPDLLVKEKRRDKEIQLEEVSKLVKEARCRKYERD